MYLRITYIPGSVASQSDIISLLEALLNGSNGDLVKADKTKATSHSGKGRLHRPCSSSMFRSKDFKDGFHPTSTSEVARRVLAIAI